MACCTWWKGRYLFASALEGFALVPLEASTISTSALESFCAVEASCCVAAVGGVG